MKKLIGGTMLAAPFVLLFVAISFQSGVTVALIIFGGIALLLWWTKTAVDLFFDW